MKWKASDTTNGQSLIFGTYDDGLIVANVYYDHESRRHDYIVGDVTTGLFPKVERRDFVTMADAREWCEKWVGFAVELLEARKTIAHLREQSQEDFQTITALRVELHDYKYPHTSTEEVKA
jgi:hypothetical protein